MLQGPLRRLFVGIGCFEVGNAAATVTRIPAGPHVDRTDARRVLTIDVAAFAPVATDTSDHIRGSAFGLGPHTERS